MMIEDEAAVYLADGFLRQAFDNLDRCGRELETTGKFGGYCAARVFAAAKFVRAADELLRELHRKPQHYDRVVQGLSNLRVKQFSILEMFARHINTSEWCFMPQADRIRSAENAFELCRKGEDVPCPPTK
jgi:hypothetical protein